MLDALLAGAPTGGIALSAATAPHVEWRFELAPGESDAGFRLIGPERSGFDAGGSPLSRFMGRNRDLAVLGDRLVRAENGHGQIIGIVGEPGVGKSRLLREFRQGLGRERVRFLTDRCLPSATAIPYLPVVDLVRTAFGISDVDPVDSVADALHAGLRRRPARC